MTILQIGILACVALIVGKLRRGRELTLLAVSAFVVYWLQPGQPFVSLVFWLPTGMLAMTVLSWALISTPENRSWKQNGPAFAVLIGVTLLVDLNRYFRLEQIYMATTPIVQSVIAAVIFVMILVFIVMKAERARKMLFAVALAAIVIIFIFLKSPFLSNAVIDLVKPPQPDTARRALSWLGFSYVAFRLMHTLRDRQSGRLPSVSLAEYVNYVIFFPAFTAGPIDRLERFIPDLRSPLVLENQAWVEAGTRLFIGLFKKFVLADALAVIALNDALVSQVKSAGWMWVFLYAYAFRIYFDFSGYTDIAIGTARLLGIRLPENFAAPYLKSNLTQFWNSWHITLTQWFRAYFFNPVTRFLRSGQRPLPVFFIILVTQISTMTLIGLWHGVTWGFVLWGLWHGFGLFIQNRWSEFVRGRLPAWTQSSSGQRVLNIAGIFLTFNFVSLGWLFFTLSTPAIAWQAALKLFGFGT